MRVRLTRFMFVLVLCACTTSNASSVPVPTATPFGTTLYAYSPDDRALVATYPASTTGKATPSTVLSGDKTKFVGGTNNLFGGAIAIGPDGSLYVFDGVRAIVLTFAPGSKGNAAPIREETLLQISGSHYAVPQYSGFALDPNGNFWTANRHTGMIERFPLDSTGIVKPSMSIQPQVQQGAQLVYGVASTVASDGEGNIYCVCQPHDLALQLYCITEYNVRHSTPKLVRSFYGILGSLDTQIPSDTLYVDGHMKRVYEAIWTPAAVVEYPSDAPSGPAPRPRIIGGVPSMLDAVPAAIATDSTGNVYVAQGSQILVFDKNANLNQAPMRIITDRRHLHFLGHAYGDLLTIR